MASRRRFRLQILKEFARASTPLVENFLKDFDLKIRAILILGEVPKSTKLILARGTD